MYDDQKYGLRQTLAWKIIPDQNDNAVAEVIGRMRFFKDVKILNIRGMTISTAYSSTDTFQILNDDTAMGDLGVGGADITTFEDMTISAGTLLAATSSLEVQCGTADAIGSTTIMIQYQEMFV